MFRKQQRTITILLLLLMAWALASCSEEATVTTGNNSIGTTGPVTLKSMPYTVTTGVAAKVYGRNLAVSQTSVTDFKFCITQIKMTDDGAGLVDGTAIEAILGLVDVSDQSADTTWGTLDIPVGFNLTELAVEVHKDAENCSGANYSLSYNGVLLNKDLEFKFTFNPVIAVEANSVLSLALSKIASAFQTASEASALSDETIGAYVESMIETGVEDATADATTDTTTDTTTSPVTSS